MKLKFCAGICLLLIAAGCGQTQQAQGYKIEGSIKGIQSGTVKLVSFNDDTRTSSTLDSATFTNGAFKLEGKAESPGMVTLQLDTGNWALSFFLENSDISITADTTGAEYYDWSAYGGGKGARLKNYTVAGSANHDQWMAYQNDGGLKKYEPVFKELGNAYNNAKDKEEANKIKDRMDSVRTLYTALQKRWIDSFITANPSSPAGAYLFYDYYKFNEATPVADMESVLAKFTGPAQSTAYFKSLTRSFEKKTALQPGNVAPDFTLLKPDSSQFTLSSLRGKYVLLDFWASWCVPCRKAIPHWKEVYNKYQPKGFEIVAVTNDSRWSDWFKALEEEKMPWVQVADEFPVKNMPSRVGTLYMTPYLPCYVLLDKEGKVLLHNATKEQIDGKLKELMGA